GLVEQGRGGRQDGPGQSEDRHWLPCSGRLARPERHPPRYAARRLVPAALVSPVVGPVGELALGFRWLDSAPAALRRGRPALGRFDRTSLAENRARRRRPPFLPPPQQAGPSRSPAAGGARPERRRRHPPRRLVPVAGAHLPRLGSRPLSRAGLGPLSPD